jgi:hypothetical protein
MDGRKMKIKFGGIILSLFIFIGISKASVPPEIPQERTMQIYSPFYESFGESGENIFLNNGSVSNLRYLPTDAGINIYNYEPSSIEHVGDLQKFITLMETPAGITFLSTHGMPERFVVEGYPGTCDADDATSGCV